MVDFLEKKASPLRLLTCLHSEIRCIKLVIRSHIYSFCFVFIVCLQWVMVAVASGACALKIEASLISCSVPAAMWGAM